MRVRDFWMTRYVQRAQQYGDDRVPKNVWPDFPLALLRFVCVHDLIIQRSGEPIQLMPFLRRAQSRQMSGRRRSPGSFLASRDAVVVGQ